MRILGIDYGRKKIGLAIGDTDSKLSQPYRILRYEDIRMLREEIKKVTLELGVKKIVIGVSEGKMEEESRDFGKELEEILKIKVVFQDETLTTHEAQELSIRAQIKRKKRKAFEDAYSASLMLQSYLDSLK
jgi:putative Holliday junction resolvase